MEKILLVSILVTGTSFAAVSFTEHEAKMHTI